MPTGSKPHRFHILTADGAEKAGEHRPQRGLTGRGPTAPAGPRTRSSAARCPDGLSPTALVLIVGARRSCALSAPRASAPVHVERRDHRLCDHAEGAARDLARLAHPRERIASERSPCASAGPSRARSPCAPPAPLRASPPRRAGPRARRARPRGLYRGNDVLLAERLDEVAEDADLGGALDELALVEGRQHHDRHGARARIRRAASMPSSRGIFTSMTARSGTSVSASATASSPSRASAHDLVPGALEQPARSRRMMVSSSAIRISSEPPGQGGAGRRRGSAAAAARRRRAEDGVAGERGRMRWSGREPDSREARGVRGRASRRSSSRTSARTIERPVLDGLAVPSPSSETTSITSSLVGPELESTSSPPCSSALPSSSQNTSASAVARSPRAATSARGSAVTAGPRRGPARASRGAGRSARRGRRRPRAARSAARAPRRSRGSG